MEYEFYESYRIGKIRNEVECPARLDNSEVMKISYNFRNKIINDSKTIEPPIILLSTTGVVLLVYIYYY